MMSDGLSPQHCSVIVSTYNAPTRLALVLRALAEQDYAGPFEVVVADDGSDPPTAKLVTEFAQRVPFPLIHAWHEDQGFRLAATRNHGVSKSSGDYLIFLDGDCLVGPNFLSGHARLAEPGHMVCGRRVRLREGYSAQLLERQELPPGDRTWLRRRLSGELDNIRPLLYFPFLRYRKATQWRGVLSGNLGLWREDFERVNGYDESYVGWGDEDHDLAVRLIRSGIKRKEGRSDVPIFHLWHPKRDRSAKRRNRDRLEEVLDAEYTWAPVGLRK